MSFTFSALPLQNLFANVPTESLALFAGTGLCSMYLTSRTIDRNRRIIRRPAKEIPKPSKKLDFDILIVGAGPSGSTAAYYSVTANSNLKVGLFDKKQFPRVKFCGDAWCAPALDLLEEMNILPQMEKDGIVHPVKRGGLISPFGYECINTDGDAYGSVTGCKTYAIKREIADEYLVRAAGKAGAQVYEGYEITGAEFTPGVTEGAGFWTVTTKDESGVVKQYTTRLLFLCDGSTSYMAQKLGIIPAGSQPEAVSSTAYVTNNAWKDADGVMLFNKSVLPGYSALFRHYNGDMYLGTYILPGGKATSRSIAPFETEAITAHPYIKAAMGDQYTWTRKRTVAPIRLGGVERSYSDQLLVVGDAAGHVDPLTGEGIHTAMIAGKIAAQCAYEMFQVNNFTRSAGLAYQLRCYDRFVHEFVYSSIAAKVIYYCPLAIDAVACVGRRRGQAFLDFFGEVMTGVKPKSAFLEPGLVVEILFEMVNQFIVQYIFRRKPLIPDDIGQKVVDAQAGKKTGSHA